MKKSISVVCAVILMMTFTACGKGDVKTEINKRYQNLESYTASVRVTVTGNKGAETYQISQSWRAPEQYRAEVVSPERLRGTVSVINGKAMWFRSADAPAMQMERGMAESQTDYLFLPDFLAEYYGQEPLPELEVNEEGLVMLSAARRGSSQYRFNQTLWIDAKSKLPAKLVTWDADGNEILRVEYEDFVLNAKLEDTVFLP